MYSIRKSRHILKSSYKWYQKDRQKLSKEELNNFESLLQQLDEAVLNHRREEADRLARQIANFCHTHFKKGIGTYLLELLTAVAIALVVATIVRQSWFEPYEIPTGSMRPTFKEQDHLTVTKTAFSLNVPLATKHFYFNPGLVQRSSIIIWSGDGIPYLDSEAKFMGIIPYTKRYIKRCLGKPGDTLYFYGGKIYGFDNTGNELVELLDNPWMAQLEHLPFTNFDGRRSYTDDRRFNAIPEVTFNHFNQPIGRLRFFPQEIKGEIFNGQNWVADRPEAQKEPHHSLQTYSDFWGIRNFAIVRLLNRDQLESLTPYRASEMEEGILYLELRHTPSLSYPLPLISERFGVALKGYTTVLPLQEKHLKSLMENMYTCRFVVKNGRATAYRIGGDKFNSFSPKFSKVADGTYEFYYGKALKVDWGAITTLLPTDHPLYSTDPKNIQKLFNVGIEMNTQVEPDIQNQLFFPNRYAYFRNGDLYVMGGIIIEKEDPILKNFNEREIKKEKVATSKAPYVAFKDYGPPLTQDGQLDKNFIKTFGLKIPDDQYLMLGDNHAMSQDSRYFGPIPQNNLQGAPSLIIWPPGDRWGAPNQKPYPLFTLPRLIVWSIATLLLLTWYIIHRRNLRKPIFKKLS